jgi:hypothetical protein
MKTVLEQELEALEIYVDGSIATNESRQDAITALAALKEAIKQQGEPFGYVEPWQPGFVKAIGCCLCDIERNPVGKNTLPVYTSAPTMLSEQAPCDIPEGWQLVPKEPTPTQVRCGQLGVTTTCAIAIYKAMLSAAPKEPAQ